MHSWSKQIHDCLTNQDLNRALIKQINLHVSEIVNYTVEENY